MRICGEALLSQFDRGCGDLAELHGAEASERGVDSGYLARHRDCEDAILRQLRGGFAVAHEHVGTRLQRRGLAIVERGETAVLGGVYQHEAAAADSARSWIGHANCERGRDCR